MSAFYTAKQIRQIEQIAIQQGFSSDEMMERAAKAAFSVIRQRFRDASSVTFLCGFGNNAGDGFVLASLLKEKGLSVDVFAAREEKAYQGPAAVALLKLQQAGVSIQPLTADSVFTGDLIVDALLGIGVSREVSGELFTVIERVNRLNAPVFSLDMPSGLDPDTGGMHGVCIQADVTLAFVGYKQGQFTRKGPGHCGELLCHDLDLPREMYESVQAAGQFLSLRQVQSWIPRREKDTNKGDYGHVLVIGGDYGMGGAVRMASEAAMRSGAGLVTVATRPEHVNVVSGACPEIMCHAIEKASDLSPLLEKATVIAIGPGLGQTAWAQELLALVLSSDKPKVLDADALNLLAEAPAKDNNWVLTPHPGEAGRLLKQSCQDVQANRFESVTRLQEQYGGAVVLKGVGTIIGTPDLPLCLCRAGNPGMASGGMGDVLTGIIGGLLAQGLTLSQAAVVGVVVHAYAGDRAAQEGGERGLLATDLLRYLRGFINGQA